MIIISAIRIKIGLDINPQDLTFDYTRISLLSTVVLALGLLSSCLPLLSPAAGRIFQTTAFSPPLDAVATSPILLENRETTIVLGLPADGRPTPMVTITMPPLTKCFSERARDHITITSDWEIRSARNSARIERLSMRRG